jgi:hypothetical protein
MLSCVIDQSRWYEQKQQQQQQVVVVVVVVLVVEAAAAGGSSSSSGWCITAYQQVMSSDLAGIRHNVQIPINNIILTGITREPVAEVGVEEPFRNHR